MTRQIALRLPDEMLAKLDEYVARGMFTNRTDAVRAAIGALIDEEEERQITEEYRRAYAEQPETQEEIETREAFFRASMEVWADDRAR